MTRLKRMIRNLLIMAVLLFLVMKVNGLYVSPINALYASERDLHYGPSQIVHSIDYGKGRYFLGRYENFIACSFIDRSLGIFWRYGAGSGVENEKERALFTSYRSNEEGDWMVFGIRNDPSIAKVEIEVQNENGEMQIHSSGTFYEDMFYIMWKGGNDEDVLFSKIFKGIKAYDDKGTVVYDSEYLI
ncbi:hypothetical protein MASR2M70_04750 [Bacillota bacterium]